MEAGILSAKYLMVQSCLWTVLTVACAPACAPVVARIHTDVLEQFPVELNVDVEPEMFTNRPSQ